jgi:hypothetical protein
VVPGIPGNMKGRDIVVELKKDTLKAGIKGQTPLIEGELPHAISTAESTWTLTTNADNTKSIEIHLDKINKMEWWAHVVTSAPKIDVPSLGRFSGKPCVQPKRVPTIRKR